MKSSNQIPALTGIRGVAALWVAMFHLDTYLKGTLGIDDSLPFIQNGFLGVDLFFILSGAVMYHVHADDFRPYSLASHLTFLKLRLARIYPLHLFCLISFAALVWIIPGFKSEFDAASLDFPKLLAALFMVNNWGFSSYGSWNPPTWSLSVEWIGYIFFPLIVVCIHRTVPKGYEILTAFLLLLFLVATICFMHLPNMNQQGKTGILRMACEFSGGCLLYRYSLSDKSAFRIWAFVLGLATALGCAYSIRFHWGTVFGLALLVMSLCKRHAVAETIFANPVIFWLGEVSFSLYLSHWPLIHLCHWYGTAMKWNAEECAILMICTIPLVTIMLYYFVESPSRRYWRKKIARHTLLVRAGSSLGKAHV